jgi:hypothetical protein
MKHLTKILFNENFTENLSKEKQLLEKFLMEQDVGAEGVTPSQYKKDSKKNTPTDYDQVHDHAIRNLTGDISGISKDYKKSISSWTQPSYPGYKEMNNHMKNVSSGDKVVKMHCDNLSHVLNNHELPNSTYAYRGIKRGTAESVRALKPGDHWSNKGFASTTLDPNRATHFARDGYNDVLAIHAPKGTKALYTSHPQLNNHTSERELTLPHNTHFQYHGSEEFEVHHHDYNGDPSGEKRMIRMHHMTVVPHSNKQMEIDKE